jgi:hypothetical protein
VRGPPPGVARHQPGVGRRARVGPAASARKPQAVHGTVQYTPQGTPLTNGISYTDDVDTKHTSEVSLGHGLEGTLKICAALTSTRSSECATTASPPTLRAGASRRSILARL